MQIHTEREIAAKKPDVMIKYHQNKTCKLIDVAININERQKITLLGRAHILRKKSVLKAKCVSPIVP